jgi:hypothetical protein
MVTCPSSWPDEKSDADRAVLPRHSSEMRLHDCSLVLAPFASSFTVYGPADRNFLVTLYNQAGEANDTQSGQGTVQVPYSATGAAETYWFSVGGDAGSYQLCFNDCPRAAHRIELC